ncbi:MgtC/SapB family protein [Halocalculus aciditolerans]|uniref:DUF4010 domain-containing protein n=1 Tax=Halocalculus aciditolerans TaxID=1383812 RepID=A0A830FLK2_9EURY|nr:DUF4010 domain-containing protein [Halocalculus aciditolerans]GGL58266.1 hypothetical protein GCM10009039_15630 [Halocalculus aciditolerans]
MLGDVPLSGSVDQVTVLAVAAGLGLFVGLEREWAGKTAGARTFPIVGLLGALAVTVHTDVLLPLTAALVLLQAVGLTVRSYLDDETLGATTSASIVVVYVAGVLIGTGHAFHAVAAVVVTTLLLTLKRELDGFVDRLDNDEIKSTAQLALLGLVVYPVLPDTTVVYGVDPREAWLFVLAVGAIGYVNYILLATYDGRGVAVSGFVGGLVSSTAVVGSVAPRVGAGRYGVRAATGVVLIANAAMVARNLVIAASLAPSLAVRLGAPLVAMTAAALAIAWFLTDWDAGFDVSFETPFDPRNVAKFGGLFVLVLGVSGFVRETFGAAGFVATSILSGTVSSASATTAAVTLFEGGSIDATTAVVAVVGAMAASVAVKVGMAASIDRDLVLPVAAASLALVLAGGVGAVVGTVL